jgi:hypothetical protein
LWRRSGRVLPYLLYAHSPSPFLIFQEIPIENVFNFVHNYKAASHFPDDKLGGGGKLSYIWVGMAIKIAIITLEKTK